MRRAVLGLALLVAPLSAQAFSVALSDNTSGYIVAWNSSTIPILLDADSTSDVTGGADLAAVREAIASWNDVACSSLFIDEIGTTTSTSTMYTSGFLDGKN